MANVKISELTALTPPAAADELPVVDVSATSTKKTTVGEIVGIINGDVEVANNGTATISELPVSKLQDGTARQLLQTDAAGTGVEWTSNVDVPGTLDVTGATTLDSTLTVPLGSEAAPTVRFTGDTNTGIYSPGADQLALSTNGTGRLFVDASGNVGVGTNLQNQKLCVAGSSTFDFGSTNPVTIGGNLIQSQASTGASIRLAISAASNPTYATTGDPNTGIFLPGSDVFGVTTAGSERLRITSAGLVGIGTSSPGERLHINGNVRLTGIAPTVQTIFAEINANNFSTTINPGVKIAATTGGNTSDHELAFYTTTDNAANTTEKVRINHLGNVGIGTTSPGSALDVVGSINLTGNHTFSTTTTPLIAATAASSVLRFGTGSGGAERARIDSSGRLLVGTSTSLGNNALLQTSGTQVSYQSFHHTDAQAGPFVILSKARGSQASPTSVTFDDYLGVIGFSGYDGTDYVTRGAEIACRVDGTPGADDMPGRLTFSVTPDGGSSPTLLPSAMTINSGQEVLIGYSADNGAYKLQVNSQIFATSATIATSDGRYKENVATLDGCVDLVKALRPVSFDWKHQEPITRINEKGETVVVREAHNFPDGTQVGFIAQEVEEVLTDKPWLGSVIKQNVRPAVTDNDGNELVPEEEFLGIAEGNLVAVLTSALKDAIGRIETLEAKVAALESA